MADPEPRLARLLALNRTVAVVLLSVLLFGLGQQLWHPFVPAYLEAQTKQLGREPTTGAVSAAALWLVAVYAMCFNLFETFCSLGGSQLTARLGDRGSLLLFGALTILGYFLFLLVPLPWATVVATLLILSWEPLSVPVTFTTVGSTVAEGQQGMAFALQSIQKRLPKIVGPFIAGWVLQTLEDRHGAVEGRQLGMQMLVGVALFLAAASLWAQWRWLPHRPAPPPASSWLEVYGRYPLRIRRLLLAEIFTRWCDWLVREFVVLYLMFVRGLPVFEVGFYLMLNNLTALVTYLPIGRLTQTVGLQPFVGWSFVFFALFPLALALVPNEFLAVAFVVYGLREVGEPARKALITSSIPGEVRAQGVGLYWGLRSLAIAWAPLVGAALWQTQGAEVLLYAAFALGVVGAAIYYVACRARAAPALGGPV
jgi:MFS family permease